MKEAMKPIHSDAKRNASAAIFAAYEKLAAKDADFEKNKPAFAKAVDKALDDHIFRPLFT